MGTSLITQKLLHGEWKKQVAREAVRARFLLPRGTFKFSFLKEWWFNRKKWQPTHYKIGTKRLVMV